MEKIISLKSKLDIVALIPARSGSKGIKDKNIIPLRNHPLLAYSIIVAQQSKFVDDVFVTTDSTYYAQISKSYGARVPFLRPEKISQDKSLDIEFFSHFIEWCQSQRKKIPDMIVHLRPSTPLREFVLLDEAIQKFIDHKDATSLRSCQITNLTPYKMFFNENGYIKPFLKVHSNYESYNQPRQNFPDTYLPNGYVDIICPTVLSNTGLLHGDKILPYLTPPIADIDDIKDYDYAAKLLTDDKYSILVHKLNKKLK